MINLKKFLFYLLLAIFPNILGSYTATGQAPKKIISLAPSVTESIYALGAQDDLLGVTTYCDYPEDARNKPKIGTLISPNIEKVLSTNPDLIITVEGVNRIQAVEKLKNLGLKVVSLPQSNNFQDITNSFLYLSEILDKKTMAQSIIQEAKTELTNLSTEITRRRRVFWQVNAKPLVTAGKNTFANSIIELSGGTNIFGDIKDKYPRINYEEVILRNPEIIILVTMGDVTADQRLFWQKFKQIDAVANNRIYLVDANLVCKPTITRFLSGVKTIKNILYDE